MDTVKDVELKVAVVVIVTPADAAKVVVVEEPAAVKAAVKEEKVSDSTNRKLMGKAATMIDRLERKGRHHVR